MTGYALPIDAASGTPSFSAQQTRLALAALAGVAPSARPVGATSGVRWGTPSTTVTLSGTGSMTWNCGPFSATLDVEASATAGPYFVGFDGTDTGPITAQDPANPRVDILYIQLNDTVQDGSGLRNATLNYLAGTAAASPVAPSPPNSRTLVIANINVPKNGTGAPSVSWVAPVAGGPQSTDKTWVVGALRISFGVVTITMSSVNTATSVVTFPVAFSSTPLVFTTLQTTSANLLTNAGLTTTSQSTITMSYKDSGTASSVSAVAWLAIGPA